MRIGLVLGAGGAFGWAWHLGVLEAVQESLGIDVRGADRVIGTSAGAAMAIAASSGADTATILEVILQRPDEATMQRMRELRDEARTPWRWLRPMAPRLLLVPGPLAGARSFVGALPAGVFPTSPLRRFPAPEVWPDNLQVTAVRLDDGERIVWGEGDDSLGLHDALEASAAVPMLFRPKVIGGRRHIDGAVASATNADVFDGAELDLVVVSSPMTRPGRRVVRTWAHRHLRRERGTLEGAGTRVIDVHPDDETVALAEGYPRENTAAGPQIVARARHLALTALRE